MRMRYRRGIATETPQEIFRMFFFMGMYLNIISVWTALSIQIESRSHTIKKWLGVLAGFSISSAVIALALFINTTSLDPLGGFIFIGYYILLITVHVTLKIRSRMIDASMQNNFENTDLNVNGMCVNINNKSYIITSSSISDCKTSKHLFRALAKNKIRKTKDNLIEFKDNYYVVKDNQTYVINEIRPYSENINKNYDLNDYIEEIIGTTEKSLENAHTIYPKINKKIKSAGFEFGLIKKSALSRLDFCIYYFFNLYCILCKSGNEDYVSEFIFRAEYKLKEHFSSEIDSQLMNDIFDNRFDVYDKIMQTAEDKDESLTYQIAQFISKDLWSNSPLDDTIFITGINKSYILRTEISLLKCHILKATASISKEFMQITQSNEIDSLLK